MIVEPDSRTGHLVASIRAEASGVRGCFRDISIKAIGLAVTGTGAILYALGPDNPGVALGALGMFLVLLAAQRLGIHKFSTTNRLLGYQLHLERLGPRHEHLALLGWEEALRAWRIVQATLFDRLYHTPSNPLERLPWVIDLLPGRLYHPRPEFARQMEEARRRSKAVGCLAESDDSYRDVAKRSEICRDLWWMQAERARLGGGAYHPGSYLERMFGMLSAAQVLSLVPLFIAALWPWSEPMNRGWALSSLVLLLVLAGVAFLNLISLRRRREILEREFLSIHSCAIVWKIVAMAHEVAWTRTDDQGRRMYTERLANIARTLSLDLCAARARTDALRFHDAWASQWYSEDENVPSPPVENRKTERKPVTAGTMVEVDLGGAVCQASLIDISKSGCGILFECKPPANIQAGAPIMVRARQGNGSAALLGGFERGGQAVPRKDASEFRSIGVRFA